jgi:hypothetical protein
MRANGTLEWGVMLGQLAGYRAQGKPRMRWLDSINERSNLPKSGIKKYKIGKNGTCWWKKRLGIGNAQM